MEHLLLFGRIAGFSGKALPAKADTFLSVQLDKCSLGFQKHLIITAVYVPPSNSRYGNIEDFIDIDNFLLDYSEDYLNLLCGDFNSHSGTLPDYATPNENFHDNIIGDDVLANLLDVFIDFDRYGIDCARYSQDRSYYRRTY